MTRLTRRDAVARMLGARSIAVIGATPDGVVAVDWLLYVRDGGA